MRYLPFLGIWIGWLLLNVGISALELRKKFQAPVRYIISPQDSQRKSTLSHRKVAIVVLTLRPSVETIIHGFTDTLEKEGPFKVSFRVYDPGSDRNLLRSHAEDIFNEQYDLVYSIGLQATTMLKEVSEPRNDQTPVVFSAVSTPVRFGLVKSLESSGNNLTGIFGDFDYSLYTNLLCRLKKNLHKVLIVYDPTGFGGTSEEWKRQIQEILEQQNILVKSVEVFKIDEIPQRVMPHLHNVDMLITLQDNTILNGIKHISKLCDMHGIPLVGANLEAISKGFGATFGVFSYASGMLAARQAIQILHKGIRPTDIPISDVGREWQLVLNSKAMKRQKFELNKNMNFLLRYTFVVGKKRI